MGLDTVEIRLSTEELFGITISDEDASRIITVGDLHAVIMKELRAAGRERVNEDIVMDQLRTLICHHLGVERERVVPGARFVQDLDAQ